MVKLLMRYYDVDSGAIRIGGHDVREFDRNDLRSMVGMVLQDTWHFKGTIRENIRYGNLEATDEQVEAAAKAAKAEADAAKAEAASANVKLEKNAFKAKKATVKKVTGKRKAAVVKVKKVKGADGYQVQYSKKANFKSAKKANTKKLNVTLKRLSKGSKYYVRVRAYKTINGQKVYTKYSAKKTVTVK